MNTTQHVYISCEKHMIIVHVEDFGSKSVLTTDIKHSIFCWICVYSVIIHVYPETENTLTITYGLDLVYLDFEFQKYKYIFMSNRCVFEHRSQCIIYNFNVKQIIDNVYGLSAYNRVYEPIYTVYIVFN